MVFDIVNKILERNKICLYGGVWVVEVAPYMCMIRVLSLWEEEGKLLPLTLQLLPLTLQLLPLNSTRNDLGEPKMTKNPWGDKPSTQYGELEFFFPYLIFPDRTLVMQLKKQL